MSRPASGDLSAVIARAGPDLPRMIDGLLERLSAAGLVRGATVGGRPIDPAAMGDIAVRGVTEDSRAARDGALFVAIRGFHANGHAFLDSVAYQGAAAALVEAAAPGVAIPQIVVAATRPALAIAAAWWFGDPSHALGTIGITGTDGKTTTAFLAAAALEAAGLRPGLLGTVETRIGGVIDRHQAHVTTPAAPELQASLAAMRAAGDPVAVIEATSHALALDRVLGVAWDAAVFTNLTHEHLELHGSFEAYRAAKLRLFEALAAGPDNPPTTVDGRTWPKVAVVNRDDPAAPWFEAAGRDAGARVVTYGTGAGAVVRAIEIGERADGLDVRFRGPTAEGRLTLRMAGRFNALNALAVVALGEGLGLDRAAVVAGLEAMPGVPGRMERIEAGQPFAVIVDYAHSPASLGEVLDILAPAAAARGGGLVAVFGSAGERDVAKRAVMGRIAAERCRLVVATDEDPRGEDREAIIAQIVRGAQDAGARPGRDVLAVPDRRQAIRTAFELARPADTVLLAGKGHEQTILYPDRSLDWDEAGVARALLADLGYGSGPDDLEGPAADAGGG